MQYTVAESRLLYHPLPFVKGQGYQPLNPHFFFCLLYPPHSLLHPLKTTGVGNSELENQPQRTHTHISLSLSLSSEHRRGRKAVRETPSRWFVIRFWGVALLHGVCLRERMAAWLPSTPLEGSKTKKKREKKQACVQPRPPATTCSCSTPSPRP